MSARLALAHAIEEAGIAREKAEDIASAVVRLVEGGSATKADLLAQSAELKTEVAAFRGDLKADIAAGRADITELRTASRTDLQVQGTELKAEIAVVRAELQVGGMLVGFIAVLGAIAYGFHWL